MAKLSHRLEYLLARAVTGIARTLPDRAADRYAAGLGSVVYRLWGARRRIAFDNLSRAFGSERSDAELMAIARDVFQSIARTLIENSRFGRSGAGSLERIEVAPGTRQLMEEVHRQGRGAILMSAHFGNWELLGAWVAAQGFDIDFAVAPMHNPLVDRLITGFREDMGVGVIPVPAQARMIFRRLRENRFVAMLADQHAPAESIVLDFLGRPAAIARGPALFAVRAGCPILPHVMVRERLDRHVMIPGPALYPPESGDREADIRELTVQFTRYFEGQIRKYPDQWLWTHRRWKVLPPLKDEKS